MLKRGDDLLSWGNSSVKQIQGLPYHAVSEISIDRVQKKGPKEQGHGHLAMKPSVRDSFRLTSLSRNLWGCFPPLHCPSYPSHSLPCGQMLLDWSAFQDKTTTMHAKWMELPTFLAKFSFLCCACVWDERSAESLTVLGGPTSFNTQEGGVLIACRLGCSLNCPTYTVLDISRWYAVK